VPILALDTSCGLAVSVVDDGEVLASSVDPEPRRHAELLAVHLDEVLRAAGCTVQDVERLVVGTGPAPFTGLRAGLVTARTMAYALGVPVDGVPSIVGVGRMALDLLQGQGEVVVVTDAKRREVYWARCAADATDGVRLVDGPGVAAPGDLVVDGAVVAGRAAGLVDGAVPSGFDALDPDPAVLVRIALARTASGLENPVEPLYLRRPDAVPAGGAKRVSG
jgi:tRNA threonylcarbamoyladenosine biosynthesis protein TsaB